MQKPLAIRLHVLSPIHIGCDDVYEPTSFVINPDRKQLIAFDPLVFVKNLSDAEKKEFSRISEKGTRAAIIEMYRFIFSKSSSIEGWSVDLAGDIVKRYLTVKGMALNEREIRQELNNFLMPRTAYNPTNNMPYIPGSSLKGSLRTGYLSMLAVGGGDQRGLKDILDGNEPTKVVERKSNASELEKSLLKGSFDRDPFRLVKVSDLQPHKNVKTKIIYAINQKKYNQELGKGIPQILDTIQAGSVFEGSISIETPIKNSNIVEPLNRYFLAAAVNKHYARVFNGEKEMARRLSFRMPAVNALVTEIRTSTGTQPFLVRLGRHSGAEAVTIEGQRRITIRGKGGQKRISERGATTIWLASEKAQPDSNSILTPFGWALIEIL